jgi:DNA helicase-2/ATP-dependent DNA helicase PcrA
MQWNKDIEGSALDVARHPGDPIRVLAGPGTGKSFALKRRVTRLLEEGTAPEEILAITFTRMAAKDLTADLISLGVAGCEEVRAGTLHGLCFSMLNREHVLQLTGRYPRTMLKHEIKYLVRDLSRDVFGTILQRETRLRLFEAAWARLQHEMPGWPPTQLDQQFQDATLSWLKFHRAMLVGEMITETLKYLRDNPMAPERSAFHHILVDEYQDLNKAEQALIDLLADNATLTVIGDDDQSIYGFKYANPEGIIDFPTSHAGTHPLTLLECRRCPVSVVRVANMLISHNTVRVYKVLIECPQNGNGEIHILQWRTLAEEADGIARIIAARIHAEIVKPEEVIVLVPRRLIGYPIRDALATNGLSVQLGFEDETLDPIAAQERYSLLNLLANPNDRVALRVLMGYGSQDGRAESWNRLRAHCEATSEPLWQSLEELAGGELKLPHMGSIVNRFRVLQSEYAELCGVTLDHFIDLWIPLLLPGVVDLRSLALEVIPSVADINELYREIKTRISQPEIPDSTGKVRVMSLHKSKGLTAKMVVVAGCVEGLIPSGIRDDDPEQLRKLEEFRRLFYVAITRTKNTLILSGAVRFARTDALQMGAEFTGRSSTVRTIASRFINELGASAPRSINGQDFIP